MLQALAKACAALGYIDGGKSSKEHVTLTIPLDQAVGPASSDPNCNVEGDQHSQGADTFGGLAYEDRQGYTDTRVDGTCALPPWDTPSAQINHDPVHCELSLLGLCLTSVVLNLSFLQTTTMDLISLASMRTEEVNVMTVYIPSHFLIPYRLLTEVLQQPLRTFHPTTHLHPTSSSISYASMKLSSYRCTQMDRPSPTTGLFLFVVR